jgi:proton-dependent oligopeptide transporter, POT family
MNKTMTAGHPNPIKPFSLLFFVELWERYGWYGMQTLLVFFMIKKFNFNDALAENTYSAFAALAYAFLSLGGYIGDKILGFKRTIFLGAFVLALGYLVLGLGCHDQNIFFVGLGIVIAGNALFKSNPSSLISRLYAADDPRLDGAFTMYYMAINVGSFIANLVSPVVAAYYGWEYAFLICFVGLILAMIGYILFNKLIIDIGSEPDFKPMNYKGLIKVILISAVLAGVSAVLLRYLILAQIVLYIAIVIVVAFFFLEIIKSESKNERSKLIVCFVLICQAVVFYILYQQRATSLNLFVIRNTHHSIFGIPLNPLSFQSFNPFWILIASPVIAIIFTKLGKKGKDISLPSKFCVGMFLCAIGFFLLKIASFYADSQGLVSGEWVFWAVGLMSVGEILIGGIGLAMIAKLSPQRVMGFMMGAWFMATAIAMVLGGFVAAYAEIPEGIINPVQTLPIYTDLFFKLGIATIIVTFIMALVAPKLKKYIKYD